MSIIINRTLNLLELLKQKSHFLFGTRGVGKSFLIRNTLPNVLTINLLDSDTFLRLESDPSLLPKMIEAANLNDDKFVVIDEIQKIPILLNEVHKLIEEKNIKFLLTGSSARKLKKEGVNLLGGRARKMLLLPLTWKEITSAGIIFNLHSYLFIGGLPGIFFSNDPLLDLKGYVDTYLKEEIQIEARIRKLPPFHRFLKIAALSNGQLLVYANLANDAQVPASTVKEYVLLLEDTLLAFTLESFKETKMRKAIQTCKFYFTDLGLSHRLAQRTSLVENTSTYGESFEHFICLELRAYLQYHHPLSNLYFWRSVEGYEVDFIIDSNIAIEVKSTKLVHEKYLKNLKILQKENIFCKYFLISLDPIHRVIDGIEIIPFEIFLHKLWDHQIL